jgi:hypothetical protein
VATRTLSVSRKVRLNQLAHLFSNHDFWHAPHISPHARWTTRHATNGTRRNTLGHTEALFHEVLRKCGSLVHEDTFGLSLVDCDILSVVSKSFRRIVTTNEC